MKKAFILIILSCLILQTVLSQDSITYHISFPNAVHHEAEISLTLENLNTETVTAIMSKSSPGRYGIHNFGKNIYHMKAYNGTDTDIAINKIEPDAWEISEMDNSLKISYTLYANYADGTYSGIDADFANLNIPSTLMWLKGMELNPVRVVFDLPDTSNWKIATQLVLLDSIKHIYGAPNLQYLMDSPCILADLTFKEFRVGDNNEITIRMAINSETDEIELEQFMNMTEAVINEQKEVFGDLPSFKDSTYTFLCSYGPGFHSDGMEHRNSTMISSPIPLTGNQSRLIGTISHEFFHVWNIERIRPSTLEPFDFTGANISGELWFGEGFTSYYGDLTLCRAGIIDKVRYINMLSQSINYFINAPGWRFGSPIFMSEMATYTDGAASNEDNNFANTYLSYYSYGEVIALALDLSLRTNFDNISLDDLMMTIWIKYGKPEKPYSNPDIQSALEEVCGDNEFARDFFEKYIYGNDLPNFENLFALFGYKLIKKNPGKPSIGFVRLKFEGDTATLISQPQIASALYDAGVNKGDLILSIDDQFVTSYPELNFIIGTRKINDEIEVSYSHYGKLKKGSFKLKEDSQLVLIPKEKFSIRITDEEEKLRQDWLNSRVKK